MQADIEIADKCKLKDIRKIAEKIGLKEADLELYGNYKAKINLEKFNTKKSKLILVTAINPTPAGEGKTTVSIGLADAMSLLGKKVCLALREPSLGPVFGVKGGATGGGYAQVVPMADMNLHFTGDLHAITSANNLLCAMIDNHIFRGNKLKIKNVLFHRCLDMNDRALRDITLNAEAGSMKNCVSYNRQEEFNITASSEIMAVLCLSKDLQDLKTRLGNIIIGGNEKGKFIYARELNAEGAMTVLLKDAIKPNLVQTLEGTPAIVHGGPFANIAHGCNSIRATYTAMTLADYTITEAGFGADLGCEKFLDTKCRIAGIEPDCIVLVATIKALKYHGGKEKSKLSTEDVTALFNGMPNLIKHIENIQNVYKKPVVVAINKFSTDTENEIKLIESMLNEINVSVVRTSVHTNGGKGAIALAEAVISECKKKSKLSFSYSIEDDIKTKINDIVKNIYGGKGAEFSQESLSSIKNIKKQGFDKLPVIIAKTQYSLSDDPSLLARPQGFKVQVRNVMVKGGAGFIVATTGDIMLMPGLPQVPLAEKIDIDKNGKIKGLS